jgi:hypothetical protein
MSFTPRQALKPILRYHILAMVEDLDVPAELATTTVTIAKQYVEEDWERLELSLNQSFAEYLPEEDVEDPFESVEETEEVRAERIAKEKAERLAEEKA